MVSVLFVRRDSIYKTFSDCDVWDIERDALRWPGGNPIVAHPPCRAWGQLSYFAKPREGEKELAIWAVGQVRQWGGVLEHPAKSRLWPFLNLPLFGRFDKFGGFSVWISQFWFGHKADKPTLLYVCGCRPEDLPPIPFLLGEPSHVVASTPKRRPQITKAQREAMPILLVKWLIDLAGKCQKPINAASQEA